MNVVISKGTAAGRSPAQSQPRTFVEVTVRTLRLDTTLPFSLYTQIEGEYLVYRHENLPFTATQQQALLANGMETLYVSSEQLSSFWGYLNDNVRSSTAESDAPISLRAASFYHSAAALTQQALYVPVSTENLTAAQTVVQSSLQLLREGKVAFHEVLRLMSSQPDQFQKALNVCQYGLALAREVGVKDRRELDAFGMGLLLMDIGMAQVPRAVVEKNGPLSFEEWTMVKKHPAMGMEMLASLPPLHDLTRAVIIGHHERLDGSGYPAGSNGSDVILAVRIAGIADVFNALTTAPHRRQPMTSFDALRLMRKEMASQFDIPLLELFMKLMGGSKI